MIELEGQLVEIIFSNDTNGYTVASLLYDGDEITVVGYMPTIKLGDKVALKGNWTMHPVYGQQLEVIQYRVLMPSTEEEIVSYLSSGMLPGVGEKMAKRIVEHFGLTALEIMSKNPERLLEVSGIGKAKLEGIKTAFLEHHELREIILFLNKYGIPTSYGVKVYKKYGAQTIDIIQENPYRLADEIRGIGFKTADQIARTLGISFDSKYRVYAGTKYIINEFNIEGHTYIPGELLIQRAKKLLNVLEDMIEEAVGHLAIDQKIQLERLGEEIIVYSMPYFYAETNTCNKIIELSKVVLEPINIDVANVICELEKESVILAQNQREAILQSVENGLIVITGGPGTGKTTTVNTIIKVFERLKKKVLLGAPTGRAAKRMTEATGKEAKTIHRLLELGYVGEQEEMSFNRNEENPLDVDVVIIDEASMVDILLMNSLLKAIPFGTRVILVGDVDQLPPVGAGSVLRDIIDSKVVKVVRLTEIFRQAQESMIIVNAHKINKGIYPGLNVKDKDFFFMSRVDEEKSLKTIIELTLERLPKHYNLDPIKDIQVLSPMKRGQAGTLNLNMKLQEHLNVKEKGKKEKVLKDRLFRQGDKVMQIKNNYTLKWYNIDPNFSEQKGEGVFNGDIGYVFDIDMERDVLTIVFDDCKLVEYEFNQLDEIELAYCVTVHKSQGSEFPVVIIPLVWGPPMLLTRNLLYTAVTRAKKLVVLVGNDKYLKDMIDNNQITTRYSGLSFRLKRFYDFHNEAMIFEKKEENSKIV